MRPYIKYIIPILIPFIIPRNFLSAFPFEGSD